jgi:methyl-accepting chemotaxis protein
MSKTGAVMLKKFFDFFLSGYSNETIEIQKKAQILLIINVLSSLFSFILIFFVLKKIVDIIFPILFILCCIASIILIKKNIYKFAALFFNIFFPAISLFFMCIIEPSGDFLIFYLCESILGTAFLVSCIISHKRYYPLIVLSIGLIFFAGIAIFRISDIKVLFEKITDIKGIYLFEMFFGQAVLAFIILYHNKDIIKITENKAEKFETGFDEAQKSAENAKKTNELLKEVMDMARNIIVQLNSSSKEIEAAAQEQTSAANEHASGVTEISSTLEELTITARQITANVGELVFASGEALKMLKEGENELVQTVEQLGEAGTISSNNTIQISELGKRSEIINQMVEIIKDVANKTNMLSINASIEASRAGEVGKGFAVVAAEVRELSRETISSAKRVEKAAREIRDLLNVIIKSSESESKKVINSGKTVTLVKDNMENVMSSINKNYAFSQKIDISIKQQENGSKQATEAMKQMAEVARQSAGTAKQTLLAVKDIVNFSMELDSVTKLLSKDTDDSL